VELFIPSSTPGTLDGEILTLDDSSNAEREAYANQLCQTINAWGRGKGKLLSAHGRIAENIGLGLMVLTKARTYTGYTEAAAPDEVAKAIAGIQKTIAGNPSQNWRARAYCFSHVLVRKGQCVTIMNIPRLSNPAGLLHSASLACPVALI
jgi:hypothetical protein